MTTSNLPRTPWYPAHTSPERPGWYECLGTRGIVRYYYRGYWGSEWCKEGPEGFFIQLRRRYPWRGLTRPIVGNARIK